MKRLVIALTIVLSFYSNAKAEPILFSHGFSLYDDWTEYLDSYTNAEVYAEKVAGNATYWRPTPTNTWGEVVYRFPLSFEIATASLSAGICAYTTDAFGSWADPKAEVWLDVSTDGVNWTNVDGSYPGNGGYKGGVGDITSIVAGSNTIYVRARLFCTENWPVDGPIFAQFIRTSPDIAVNNFLIEATAVPEPSTIVLLVMGVVVSLMFSWKDKLKSFISKCVVSNCHQ